MPAEFRHVLSRGKRASGENANVAAVPNDLGFPRFGLSVSKRVGTAVTRNLVKRRVRGALSEMKVVGGWDVVVTAKPLSSSATFATLAQSIEGSLRRVGVQTGPAGPGNLVEERGDR